LDFYPTPENPLPAGARCVTVATPDGHQLRTLVAVQPGARGTVVVLGGRGDYMERYFETMRDLQARGLAVVSFDFRGQGGSGRLLRDRNRGHIRDFSAYVEDLGAVMEQEVLRQCPAPYYALAHSTGGNILLHALRRHAWFDRAVVLSPLIGINYGLWPLPVVAALVFLACWSGFGWLFLPGQPKRPMGRKDFPGNPLTSDAWRWQRDSHVLEVAPQLGIGAPTFSWLRAARKATAALRAMGPRHHLLAPCLVIAAGRDTVVNQPAIRRFARRVPGVALVDIAESLHEILGERDEIRAQFFAAFDAFVLGAETRFTRPSQSYRPFGRPAPSVA
jgi:lysophospholipase